MSVQPGAKPWARALRRRIVVTPGFLLVAAAVFYMDSTLAVLSALAAVVHELGHCGAVYALGGRVSGLRLSFIGAEMLLDPRRPLSYPRELAVALAGPAAGLLAALVAAQLGGFLLSGLSLALAAFNLLPVMPLDGGRALWALSAGLWHEAAAARLTRAVSALTAGALLGLGTMLAVREGNFTLLITALWLLTGLLRD